MTKWKRVLSRILISAVLAVLICLLFIEEQYSYIGTLDKSVPFLFTDQTDYYDLDQDGKTERIRSLMKVSNLTSVLIYEWDNDLIDQVNVPGSLLKRSRLHTGDFNGDKRSEIYLFTNIGDTLFLSVIDPYSISDNHLLARTRIDGCQRLNGEAWYMITGKQFADMNGDGVLEFYFSIVAGFTLSPRNLFCYDLVNDTIYKSPLAGTGPRGLLNSHDLDDDGSPEFWGIVSAFGNYQDSIIPYTDMSAWLMVFSHDLEFEFEPIEFPGFGSIVDAQVMEADEEHALVTIVSYKGNVDSIHNEILLISPRGKILKRKKLPDRISNGAPKFFVRDGSIFLYDLEGKLFIFDSDLELIRTLEKDWFRGVISGRCNFPGQSDAFYYLTDDGYFYLTDLDHHVLARMVFNACFVVAVKKFLKFSQILRNFRVLHVA